MQTPTPTSITALAIADEPVSWARLGFTVAGEEIHLAGLRLHLGGRTGGDGPTGMTGWSLSGSNRPAQVDGLPVVPPPPAIDPDYLPPSATVHRNTATAVDHIVIGTPDLDRTAAAFGEQGWTERRRTHQSSLGRTLAFFVVPTDTGRTVLEVMQPDGPQPVSKPARFWGLAITVADIDAAHRVLGSDVLGAPKPAVQPGRRIATVRSDRAGIGVRVALMSPRPAAT